MRPPPHAIKGVPMGDFAPDRGAAWQCLYAEGNHCKHPRCDRLIGDSANTCKSHMMWYRLEIQAKMDRLCEMALERQT